MNWLPFGPRMLLPTLLSMRRQTRLGSGMASRLAFRFLQVDSLTANAHRPAAPVLFAPACPTPKASDELHRLEQRTRLSMPLPVRMPAQMTSAFLLPEPAVAPAGVMPM